MKKFTLKKGIIASAIILGTINLISASATNSSGSIQLSSKSLGGGAVVETVNGKDVLKLSPTNGGISHTYFEKFNVDAGGLTIQNGVQCGCVSNGSKAIINEVVGNTVSNINGRIDLVGDKARLFIINPNGINVNNRAAFSNNFADVVLSAAKNNTFYYTNSVEDGKLFVSNTGGDVNFTHKGIVRVSDVYANNINISQDSSVFAHTVNLGLFTQSGTINNHGNILAYNLSVQAPKFVNKGVVLVNNNFNLKAKDFVNFRYIRTINFNANVSNINSQTGSYIGAEHTNITFKFN